MVIGGKVTVLEFLRSDNIGPTTLWHKPNESARIPLLAEKSMMQVVI